MKKEKDSVQKEKSKKKRKIILGITVPIALIVVIVLVLLMPFVVSYYKNAYIKSNIVERSDVYVRPEMDEQPSGWEDATLSEEEMQYDITTEPSTTPSKPASTQSNTVTKKPEALPDNVNQGGMGPKYNSSNSFGNSANAINVYGKTPIYKVAQKNPDIVNVLILGTDSRDVTLERGRSDAIIILSYNRKTSEIKMLSVLRDSLVPIEGHRWNRINAAYSFDGIGLAVNTVNEIFDLDIQRFVVLDFNGVKDFINKVGGVDIRITEAEAKYFNRTNALGKPVQAGMCHLGGSPALTYMRTRKLDSDFVRTSRQQKVIQALLNKILEEKSLFEMYDLADFAFKLVKTNIPLTELTAVIPAVSAKEGGLNIKSEHVPFDGAYTYNRYNGMAIIRFNIDDAARRINSFIYG